MSLRICCRCGYVRGPRSKGQSFHLAQYLDVDLQRSLRYLVCNACYKTVSIWIAANHPKTCVVHSDIEGLQRPDVPPDIEQLLILDGHRAYSRGQIFTGELHVNTVALNRNASGTIVFMVKLRDEVALPQTAADNIARQIIQLEGSLPPVTRGESKPTLMGWIKSSGERFSRSEGEFGYTKAESSNPQVAEQVNNLKQLQVEALGIAFPQLMIQALKR